MKKAFVLLASLFFTFSLFAQKLDIEKTYEISGKAKRGTLARVERDKSSGNYTLYYVTKSNDKMAKFQLYTFDKDFNFLNLKEDELAFDKIKEKYTWFPYKGEEYSVEGITVGGNLVGTLVLKKKKVTYSWSWFTLGYKKKVEVLEKLKPKNDEGDKFYYFNHVEDDKTGDVIISCGAKDKLKKGFDQFSAQKDRHILKFNKDLDLLKDLAIPFTYYQHGIYYKAVPEVYEDDPDNPGVGGVVYMFAPFGGPGTKDGADPDMTNFTYLKIDKDLNILDKLPVKVITPYWQIDDIILSDNDVFVYGPAAAGKEKYYNVVQTNPPAKFKSVQLMKVANNKVEYLTETNLEDFAAKLKTPPSQKKTPEYIGEKFEIMNYKVLNNGDFMVVGQNFRPDEQEGNKYLDIIAFHFDNLGKLKSQYGVDVKENNEYSKKAGTPQFMLYGSNTNNLYWFLQEIRGYSDWYEKILTYPRVAKVDVKAGTISDFISFGGDGDYYLDPKFPYLETDENKVVFFGSNKSGKTIWFARVKLD